MSFYFPRVFPLISDRPVWHNGKHPSTLYLTLKTDHTTLVFCTTVTNTLNEPVTPGLKAFTSHHLLGKEEQLDPTITITTIVYLK